MCKQGFHSENASSVFRPRYRLDYDMRHTSWTQNLHKQWRVQYFPKKMADSDKSAFLIVAALIIQVLAGNYLLASYCGFIAGIPNYPILRAVVVLDFLVSCLLQLMASRCMARDILYYAERRFQLSCIFVSICSDILFNNSSSSFWNRHIYR